MTLTKSLLLGTAAGFVAIAGANAADLPSKKAAPAQYVKICDAYGAGFFYIPGTETCLRVGGYVRVEYQYQPGKDIRQLTTAGGGTGNVTQFGGVQDETGLQVRGRIDLDARTQTAWGAAQTVVRLRGANSTGLAATGAASQDTNVAAIAPGGNAGSALTMERAYIRFAGLSMGVADSAFTTMPSVMYGSFHWAGFPNGIRTVSYTAAFGGGFSATVAIENRYDFNMANVTTSAAQTVVQPAYIAASRLDTAYNLTGNIRVDQSWGYAQLSGTIGNNSLAGVTSVATSNSWAVALGVGINLPMLAAGDRLNLVAAYADGLVGATQSSSQNQISRSGWGRFTGGVQVTNSNMIATSTVAGVSTFSNVKSYSFGGIFTHYWTPSLRSHFAASYARVMTPAAGAATIAGLAATTVVPGGSTAWAIGGNLIWSPVRQLDLGVEVYYANVRNSFQGDTVRHAAWVAAGRPGANVDNWGTKILAERTF